MAALGSLAFALGGLAIYAFIQRDAARRAQQDAEFQRDEAQSLADNKQACMLPGASFAPAG